MKSLEHECVLEFLRELEKEARRGLNGRKERALGIGQKVHFRLSDGKRGRKCVYGSSRMARERMKLCRNKTVRIPLIHEAGESSWKRLIALFQVPGFIRKIAPKGSLAIHEEVWCFVAFFGYVS